MNNSCQARSSFFTSIVIPLCGNCIELKTVLLVHLTCLQVLYASDLLRATRVTKLLALVHSYLAVGRVSYEPNRATC